MGDDPAGWNFQITGFRMQFATQQGKQAGFSRAIGPGQADFLTWMQLQRSACYQGFGATREGEVTKLDHDRKLKMKERYCKR
jgi:hypothetical protein